MRTLYPHNQQAYENAVEALKTSDRTCIIHPTGTGKSLIIAKFIEEHPGKRHLLLAPGVHIMQEVSKHTDKPFMFATYNMVSIRCEEFTDIDFIYADEFHRIGADVWGDGFARLLESNPNAKIVGTSATNIRFLDDNRDMAAEIFGDNIASIMSLREAILKGILEAPQYVMAVYDAAEDFELLRKKVKKHNKLNETELLNRINASEIDWERSQNVAGIIKKYITKERDKIIVFCKSIRQIDAVRLAFHPAFSSVFGEFNTFEVHSNDSRVANTKRLEEFSNSNKPSVLYAVQMLNEGLHVSGCSTVIQVRETTSPILFYQQIGRAFSIGQKTPPLIIDFARNLRGLAERERVLVEESFNSGQTGNNSGRADHSRLPVRMHDESIALSNVLENLSIQDERFHLMYAKAKQYISEGVAFNMISKVDRTLYKWILHVRALKKAGNLSRKKEEMMESLSEIWEGAQGNAYWEQKIKRIEEFFMNLGDSSTKGKKSLLPKRELNSVRYAYKQGLLTDDQKARIKVFIDINKNAPKIPWVECYEKVKMLYAKKGSIKSDRQLSRWVTQQRLMAANGYIKQEKIDLLAAIGVVSIVKSEDEKALLVVLPKNTDGAPLVKTVIKHSWAERVEIIESFFESGGIDPKKEDDNRDIFKIIRSLKEAWRRNVLNEDEIQRLSKYIPIGDAAPSNIWDEHYKKVKEVFVKEGNVDSINYHHPLSNWVFKQRWLMKKNKLSKEKVELLAQIGVKLNKVKLTFEEGLTNTAIFIKEHGKLPVRADYSDIYKWVRNIKERYANGQLTPSELLAIKSTAPLLYNVLDSQSSQRFALSIERAAEVVLSFWHQHKRLSNINDPKVYRSIRLLRKLNDQNKLPESVLAVLTDVEALFKLPESHFNA